MDVNSYLNVLRDLLAPSGALFPNKVHIILLLYYIILPEFIPYVFQILSLMLEMHESSIPETYAGLYSFLLAPVLWERMGNIPPLVRLLRAYIEKGGEQIYSKIVNKSKF